MKSRAQLSDPNVPDPSVGPGDAIECALRTRIGQTIDGCGGWIGFDRFMAMALYEPGLGYYVSGNSIFGHQGDFVTAPEISPLFGATVARQIAAWLEDPALRACAQPTIYEFGAGTGALASQILATLMAMGHASGRYRIIETSPSLRQRQRETLQARPDGWQVDWLDELPSAIEGVVIANEVLDAIPVQIVEWDGAQWHELGVARRGAHGYDWAPRAVSAERVAELMNGDPSMTEPFDGTWLAALSVPYRTEVAPQVRAWTRTVAERLRVGAMLLLDYGFPARELYHPQRAGGTLMMHHRHRAHTDPFVHIGAQDMTAHVNYSAVRLSAERAGLSLVGYTSQARFLLNGGVLDVFARARSEMDQRQAFALAHGLQKLVSEAEMGELFKVIAFERGLGRGAFAPGFTDADRSGSL